MILAAGKGKRMHSRLPKVLFRLGGITLVEHVLKSVLPLNAKKYIIVVGYKAELVKRVLQKYDVVFALQNEQFGTAHALKSALPYIDKHRSSLLVLCGDVPFIRTETLESMLHSHKESQADLTILTGFIDNPSGYGRIVRNHTGNIVSIVEDKDATEEEKKIKEFNSGIYLFDCEKVFETIDLVRNDNAQGEFYLTDLARIFISKGYKVTTYYANDVMELIGINSQQELARAERLYFERRI